MHAQRVPRTGKGNEMRTTKIVGLTLGCAVGLGACLADGERRNGVPGLGQDDADELPVEYLEEGEYGPVAQHLVNNAKPIPGNEPDPGDPAEGGCTGFACNDGTCIDAAWKCDGVDDCAQGEDEAGCPGGDVCTGFECNDGKCISSTWKCDGITDCDGGEDEADCPNGGGDPACTGFECNDGTCIDANWTCDGIVDCPDGEDEAGCQASMPGGSFSTPTRTAQGALSCIASWTYSSARVGAQVGKVISSSCTAGGAIVGLKTAGTGFAAATVCYAANKTQVDTVLGGILGAVTGLVGGVWYCEGDAFAEATDAIDVLLSTGTLPTFVVQDGESDVIAMKCGVPVKVPPSGDEAQCKMLHDDMKDFASSHAHHCDIDVGAVGNDPAAVEAACADIRRRFENAAEVAERRLEIGERCYDNGNLGPMGNSDYGHQVQWCSVHRAMEKCVEQARHPKLNCDLTQTMQQHFKPTGCGNLLSCQ